VKPPLSPHDEAIAIEALRKKLEAGGFRFKPWPIALVLRPVGDGKAATHAVELDR
jgi:hypothetical protein